MILLSDRLNPPCLHHLGNNPAALACTRIDPHDEAATGGHTYVASAGAMDAEAEA